MMGSKPSKTLWWVHGDGGPLMPLDSLAEGSMADHVVLEEYRAAEPRDLPDLADDVADAVSDWLRESDYLSHDDGWPVIDEAAFAAAIRESLRTALSEHADLSEAAWQPTGRTMTAGEARAMLWHPDGAPKAQEVG